MLSPILRVTDAELNKLFLPDTPRKVVIIETPLRGNNLFERQRNALYRDLTIRDAIINHNEVPLASHKLFVGPLLEDHPLERLLGIELGYELWRFASSVVFYLDYGLSSGMKAARDRLASSDCPDGLTFSERLIGRL